MNYVQKILSELCADRRFHDYLSDDDLQLLDLYAVLALIKGEDVTLEDVHDAWAVWQNRTDPRHRSIIPFEQLSEAVQELDRPYADAIRAAVRRLKAKE